MSKSSNAFFRGIYGGAMRNAAPILFCLAILVFIITVSTYTMVYWIPILDDDPTSGPNIYFLFDGLLRAVKDSALLFAGAAIIWAVRTRAGGGEN